MKNLVASAIVTVVLIINLLFAIYVGLSAGNPTLIVGQGIWLIPAAWWLWWSIKRVQRQRVQEVQR